MAFLAFLGGDLDIYSERVLVACSGPYLGASLVDEPCEERRDMMAKSCWNLVEPCCIPCCCQIVVGSDYTVVVAGYRRCRGGEENHDEENRGAGILDETWAEGLEGLRCLGQRIESWD